MFPFAPERLRWMVPLTVALLLSGVMQAGWFWDDLRLILHNPVVQELDWRAALGKHLWSGVGGTEGNLYWRPLLLCSFLLDRLLGGSSELAHLQSLGWHLLAVMGVQQLATRWATPQQAAGAALLFGLHPAACESVFWVSARNDLMVTAFLVWSIRLFGEAKNWRGLLLVIAACLSKETGFLAPLIALLFGVGGGWAAGGATIGLGLRALAGVPLLGSGLQWTGVGTAGCLLLGQMTVPWPLLDVVWIPGTTLGAWTILGMIGTLALLAGGLWKGQGRPLTAALLLALPGLLSVGNTGLSGERFLYSTLAFLSAALAPIVRREAGLLLPLAVGIIGLRTVEWTSEESLLRAARERAPSSLLSARLGLILEADGKWEEALRMYEEGLSSKPTFTNVCGRPVALLRKAGRSEEAEQWIQKFECGN